MTEMRYQVSGMSGMYILATEFWSNVPSALDIAHGYIPYRVRFAL